MKIKDDIVLAEVAGEYIAVPTGKRAGQERVIMRLNGTARFIWQGVASGKTAEEIAEQLAAEYDVDRETALEKTRAFLARLTEVGVLEE